jgi:hypothetical protein
MRPNQSQLKKKRSIPGWALGVSSLLLPWLKTFWGWIGDILQLRDIAEFWPAHWWRPDLSTVQFILFAVGILWLSIIVFWPERKMKANEARADLPPVSAPSRLDDAQSSRDVFLEWDVPDEGRNFSGLGLKPQIIAVNRDPSRYVYNVSIAPIELSETLTFDPIPEIGPGRRVPVEPRLARSDEYPLENFFTSDANAASAADRGLIRANEKGVAEFRFAIPVTVTFATAESAAAVSLLFEYDTWNGGKFTRIPRGQLPSAPMRTATPKREKPSRSHNLSFVGARVANLGYPRFGNNDLLEEKNTSGHQCLLLKFSNEPTTEHIVDTARGVRAHIVYIDKDGHTPTRIPAGCWVGREWNWVYIGAAECVELILAAKMEDKAVAVENTRNEERRGGSTLRFFNMPDDGRARIRLVDDSGMTLLDQEVDYSANGYKSYARVVPKPPQLG